MRNGASIPLLQQPWGHSVRAFEDAGYWGNAVAEGQEIATCLPGLRPCPCLPHYPLLCSQLLSSHTGCLFHVLWPTQLLVVRL